MHGAVHLVLFAAFIFLVFVPSLRKFRENELERSEAALVDVAFRARSTSALEDQVHAHRRGIHRNVVVHLGRRAAAACDLRRQRSPGFATIRVPKG